VKRRRSQSPDIRIGSRSQPELMVAEYIATRRGDPDRGPMVRLNSAEARLRLIQDGELVWVRGPRRKELAVLVIDETVPVRNVALRDIAGVTIAEHVVVMKPDLDTPPGKQVG